MKKSILAIAVAMSASSVNAFEVYNSNGSTVSLSGEVNAFVKSRKINVKSEGITYTHETDPSVNATGNLQVDAEHKVNNDITAFATFEFDTGDKNNSEFDEIAVGVKGNFGKAKLGETGSSYEALEKAQFSNELDHYDVLYDSSKDDGKGIRYELELGKFDLSMDYQSRSKEEEQGDYSASLNYDNDTFSLAVGYLDSGKKTKEQEAGKAYGASGSVNIGNLAFSTTYTSFERQNSPDFAGVLADHLPNGYSDPIDGNSIAIATKYSYEDFGVYTGYEILDIDDSEVDVTNIYVGAEYNLHKQVTVFAEVAKIDFEELGDGTNVVVGTYFKF